MEEPITSSPEPTMTEAQAKEQLEQITPQNMKIKGLGRFWYIFVIIVLSGIIAFGSVWMINQGIFKPSPTPTPSPSPTTAEDEETQALDEQGTSDETDEIEKDLLETDLTGLDKELTDIENELSSP